MQLTALRSTARLLLRHKSFSLINNILGLAIGLSACLLLYLYVNFELSYDAYNEKTPRIARVTSILHSPESDIAVAGTPPALAPALLRDCPEIEATVRLESANLTIRKDGEMVGAGDFYYSDQSVFSVFSFTFLEGSAKAALTTPNAIVLARSAAKRLFRPRAPRWGRTFATATTTPTASPPIITDLPRDIRIIPIEALLSKDFQPFPDLAGPISMSPTIPSSCSVPGPISITRFTTQLPGHRQPGTPSPAARLRQAPPGIPHLPMRPKSPHRRPF